MDKMQYLSECAESGGGLGSSAAMLALKQSDALSDKTRNLLAATPKITVSCEDHSTLYATFPDGLRLVFRQGQYIGWYHIGVEDTP